MKNKIWKISVFICVVAVVLGGVFFIFKNKSKTVKIENINQNISDNSVSSSAEEKNPTENSNENASADEKNLASAVDTTGKTNTTDKTNETDSLKIIQRLVNFGFQKASGRSIDTIIIHSTYDALGKDPYSVSGVIAEYRMYGVSPHYLIDREGNIYRLVADQNIAYHAGVSQTPDGRTNVNDFSLGIEIIETKSDSPNAAQYASLKELLTQIKSEYKIKYVLGHKDIAPGRKDDPWNFNFEKLK